MRQLSGTTLLAALVIALGPGAAGTAAADSGPLQRGFCDVYQRSSTVDERRAEAHDTCLALAERGFERFLDLWAGWTSMERGFAMNSPCFTVWCPNEADLGSCGWQPVKRCTTASVDMKTDLVERGLMPRPGAVPWSYPGMPARVVN